MKNNNSNNSSNSSSNNNSNNHEKPQQKRQQQQQNNNTSNDNNGTVNTGLWTDRQWCLLSSAVNSVPQSLRHSRTSSSFTHPYVLRWVPRIEADDAPTPITPPTPPPPPAPPPPLWKLPPLKLPPLKLPPTLPTPVTDPARPDRLTTPSAGPNEVTSPRPAKHVVYAIIFTVSATEHDRRW